MTWSGLAGEGIKHLTSLSITIYITDITIYITDIPIEYQTDSFQLFYCIGYYYFLCPLLITSLFLPYIVTKSKLLHCTNILWHQPPILLELSPFQPFLLTLTKLSE